MADDLDDCEFWLPPQFLADDELKKGEPKAGFGFELQREFLYGGFGSGSDLSSPVESVNETESDEDDFISGLTRKIANSTLEYSAFEYNNCSKGWRLSGSPQSTLCGFGVNQISSRGSTNCSSRASSPPLEELPAKADGGAWDLLYAAAGDVARMKMMEESALAGLYPNRNGIWAPPRNSSPVGVPQRLGLMNSNQHSNCLAQQQEMGKQSRVGLIPCLNNNPHPNMFSWPTLQQSLQQPCRGSGMRAVFIGNPGGGAKRECAGTGVFLPRTVGTPSEPRKNPACSTVLLPEKVVHALNLNLEAQVRQPQLLKPRYTPRFHDGGGSKNQRSNWRVPAQQRRNPRPSPACSVSQELRLPQEWTY